MEYYAYNNEGLTMDDLHSYMWSAFIYTRMKAYTLHLRYEDLSNVWLPYFQN